MKILYEAKERADSKWLPPLRMIKFVVTSTEVKAAFSTPVTVLGALTGVLIFPERGHCYKPAGTAYTIAGVTSHGLSWSDGTSINLFAPGGFLDQAAEKAQAYAGSGSSVSLWTGIGGGQFGLAMQYRCSGANPAAGDMDLFYMLTYRLWPLRPRWF